MTQTVLSTPTGNDVMSEDPTVQKIEEHASHLFNKYKDSFVITSTMGNLVPTSSQCGNSASSNDEDDSESEVAIGSSSHLCDH